MYVIFFKVVFSVLFLNNLNKFFILINDSSFFFLCFSNLIRIK